jgi:hypothetical protein
MASDWYYVFDETPDTKFVQTQVTAEFIRHFRHIDPTTDSGCRRFASLIGLTRDATNRLVDLVKEPEDVVLLLSDDEEPVKGEVDTLSKDGTTTTRSKPEKPHKKKKPSPAFSHLFESMDLWQRASLYLRWRKLQHPLISPSSIMSKIKVYEDLNLVLTHVTIQAETISDSQLAIWMEGSGIESVNAGKGFGQDNEKRASAIKALDAAAPNFIHHAALIAFVISCLPFLSANRKVLTEIKLEPATAPSTYLGALKVEPVFKALAFYVVTTEFEINDRLRDGLQDLAEAFCRSETSIIVSEESMYAKLVADLQKFNPIVKTGSLQTPSEKIVKDATFKKLSKNLANTMIVELARLHNPTFNV